MTKFSIVLPIENYAREVDYKILLGAYLCKQFNASAIITHTSLAYKLALQLGSSCIYIGKNIFSNPVSNSPTHANSLIDNSLLMRLLESGVRVLFSDEEGGLFLRGDNSDYDIRLMRLRTPLRDDQKLFANQDFAMFHWGPYQLDLIKENFPHLLHFNAGAPFLDAAKIYGGLGDSLLCSSITKKVYELSLTSNAAVLSNFSFKDEHIYLSLSSQMDLNPMWASAIQSEARLAALANDLRSRGLQVCYRPHPSSTATVAQNWIKYCKSNDIGISYPTVESSLMYLLRSRVNIHPGCSTSLQSYFLNLPTVKYASFGYGLHDSLVKEHESSNAADLIRDLPSARVPSLGPLASRLLASTDHSDISSFISIASYLNEYPLKTKMQSISVRSIRSYLVQQNLRFELKRYCRGLLSSYPRFGSKFTRFYPVDVERNLKIANSYWPLFPVKLACGLSQSLMLSPASK